MVLAGGCGVYDGLDEPAAIKLMDDTASADARRTGISYLVTRAADGTRPPFPARVPGSSPRPTPTTPSGPWPCGR